MTSARYSRPELRRALSSQYALGTLRGAARRRLENLMAADPGLRAEARWWEQRLAVLAMRLKPIQPRDIVWLNLEHRVRTSPTVTPITAQPARLRRWQQWAWLATAASVLLGVALYNTMQSPPASTQVVMQKVTPPPMYVAMLQPEKKPASWMVMVHPEMGQMKVKVLNDYPMDGKHVAELWVMHDGKPVSAGVMPHSGAMMMAWPKDVPFAEKMVVAVSMEPMGGSPMPWPTGPVLATGEIHLAG
jgi:anti-sigma-K factor RskA